MNDLAVIIVTWNVRHLIEQALQSLLDDLGQSGLTARVIVVDSASSDGTPDLVAARFPQVDLIASDENLGFGRANNTGMQRLGFDGSLPPDRLPRAVYLLNPDTITQVGATRTLYDALFSQANVGLVGAQLSYGDGSFQHGAFTFPGLRQLWAEFFPIPGRWRESRFNGRYARALYHAGQPFPVDFTLGATMMLRREVILQTGMFDEAYFMYCEEIDWAWRIHAAGWDVWCVPAAHVVHLSGQSSGQVRPRSVVHLWESRLRFIGRAYPRWKQSLARLIIRTGMGRKIRQLPPDDPHRDALREAYQMIQTMARHS